MTELRELVIHDETAAGRTLHSLGLPVIGHEITVRELVRLRVREEVARHNAAPREVFAGLVRPTDAEQTANGYRLPSARRIDWEEQADVAEVAFARNGFFVIVDDQQVADLDQVVNLRGDPYVAFVRLTPLAGG